MYAVVFWRDNGVRQLAEVLVELSLFVFGRSTTRWYVCPWTTAEIEVRLRCNDRGISVTA